MMNKTRHTNRLGMIALLCLTLGVGILFAGCGKAPQDQIKAVTKVETKAPAKAATEVKTPDKPADKANAPQPANAATAAPAMDKQAAQEALFTCYNDLLYIKSGNDPTATPEKVATYEKTWASLLAQCPSPEAMCDEADLVASSFKRPAKEGDPTFLNMLFRVNKAFDKDRAILIQGLVDESHRQYLPAAYRDRGYDAEWGFPPEPPTTQWKDKSASIGGKSYIVIRRGVVAADIPYNIKIYFSINDNGPNTYSLYGKMVDLGWRLAD